MVVNVQRNREQSRLEASPRNLASGVQFGTPLAKFGSAWLDPDPDRTVGVS